MLPALNVVVRVRVFVASVVVLIVIVIAGWLLLGKPAAGVGLSHAAYEWRAFIFGYCFSRVKRPKAAPKKESVLGMPYWAYFAQWFTCCANLHSSPESGLHCGISFMIIKMMINRMPLAWLIRDPVFRLHSFIRFASSFSWVKVM